MATIPCVPTLSSVTFLTNPPDVIAYVLRHFCSSPKSVNETLIEYTISMMDIISRYGDDVDAVCVQTIQSLTQAFTNIYGVGSTTVEATPQTSDNVNYSIEINVSITYNGQTYSIANTVTTDSNGRLILN